MNFTSLAWIYHLDKPKKKIQTDYVLVTLTPFFKAMGDLSNLLFCIGVKISCRNNPWTNRWNFAKVAWIIISLGQA